MDLVRNCDIVIYPCICRYCDVEYIRGFYSDNRKEQTLLTIEEIDPAPKSGWFTGFPVHRRFRAILSLRYSVFRRPTCFMSNILNKIEIIKLFLINPVLCDVLLPLPYKGVAILFQRAVICMTYGGGIWIWPQQRRVFLCRRRPTITDLTDIEGYFTSITIYN